jgi:hypothetical protein
MIWFSNEHLYGNKFKVNNKYTKRKQWLNKYDNFFTTTDRREA